MLDHEMKSVEFCHRGYKVYQEEDTRNVYLKRKGHIIAKMPCRRPLDEESLRVRVDCYIELLKICEMIEKKKRRDRKEKARGTKKKEKEKAIDNYAPKRKKSDEVLTYFSM